MVPGLIPDQNEPNLDVHTNGLQEPCWHVLYTTTVLGKLSTQILPVQYYTTCLCLGLGICLGQVVLMNNDEYQS